MDRDELTRWEKRKRRTRGQLKAATLDLLLEKGYQDLTIQDITDRADFARGTFYVHFGSKDEIVWAIFEEDLQTLTQEVISIRETSYLRRKYLTWQRAFAYAHEHRDLLQVMLGPNGHPGFAQRLQDYIAQFIEAGITSGLYDPQLAVELPKAFMAQFMTGALVRLMLWSLDTAYTPDELATMFYEILYREPLPQDIKQ